MGNFLAVGIFFRYQIPCMNFFRLSHEYFLVGVHDFFSFNFPLREYVFCTSSPAPDKFSNGPSFRDRLGAASQSYRNCSEITVVVCEQ